MKFRKVIMVGVGLMGGSIAQDFLGQKIAAEVVGFDTNTKNLIEARRLKVVTRAGSALKQELETADLVVLAMPVGEIIAWIKKNARFVLEKTWVMDVGSTKKTILAVADRCFPRGNFVGTHPMAGTEKSGVKASSVNFFKESPCVIVAGKKSAKAFVQKTKSLWRKLGARVYEMGPEKHDQYVAACSHLPHVLAFVLMNSLEGSFSLKFIRKIMGNSFRGMTRISGSDAQMWADIFLHNKLPVRTVIKSFQKKLGYFDKSLKKGSARLLKLQIQNANCAHKKVWS